MGPAASSNPCPLRKGNPQRCVAGERGFLCGHCPKCQLPYDEHYELLTKTPTCRPTK